MLPNELLLKIVLMDQSFETIVQLSMVCRRFYHLLFRNASFGRALLMQQAADVRVETHISMQVSQFDKMLFGRSLAVPALGSTTKDDVAVGREIAFIVHHSRNDRQFMYTDVYMLHASLTGQLHTRKLRILGDFMECSLQHHRQCVVCAMLHPATITHTIDKQFVVFFKTWTDTVDIRMSNRMMLTLHCKASLLPEPMTVWRIAEKRIIDVNALYDGLIHVPNGHSLKREIQPSRLKTLYALQDCILDLSADAMDYTTTWLGLSRGMKDMKRMDHFFFL